MGVFIQPIQHLSNGPHNPHTSEVGQKQKLTSAHLAHTHRREPVPCRCYPPSRLSFGQSAGREPRAKCKGISEAQTVGFAQTQGLSEGVVNKMSPETKNREWKLFTTHGLLYLWCVALRKILISNHAKQISLKVLNGNSHFKLQTSKFIS